MNANHAKATQFAARVLHLLEIGQSLPVNFGADHDHDKER